MIGATGKHGFSAREAFALFLILIPLLSLAVAALAWLRYGIDLPLRDDWRTYDTGQTLSLDPAHLLAPANKTLYPVGKALEVLAQRYLGGSAIAYQFLSMIVVLGALLWLQWRLLNIALQDRLLAASAFSLTVLMLQPGSYWGIQNLAYQQAVPLVFLLAALLLILGTRWPRHWLVPTVVLLGVLSGMTYISGAFSALVAGAVLLAFAVFVRRDEREQLVWGGSALLAAGLVTSAMQYSANLNGGAALGFPNEGQFWYFLLGKIARGAMLHTLPLNTAYLLTVLLIAVVVVALAALLWRTVKGPPKSLSDVRVPAIYMALVAVIFVYLLMVSAGRAKMFAPEVDSSMSAFARGLTRFHFFWVTLLWPWLAAALYSLLGRPSGEVTSRSAIMAILVPSVLLPAVALGGGFGHFSYQQYRSQGRLEVADCLEQALRVGAGIVCPRLMRFDLAGAYAHALQIGASFTRIYPIDPIGVAKGPALYRLSTAATDSWKAEHVAKIEDAARDLRVWPKKGNPTFSLHVDAPEALQGCVVLEASMLASAPAEFSFQKPEDASFEKARRQRPFVQRDRKGMQEYVFQMGSSTGFAGDFRLELASGDKPAMIGDLELRCRLRKAVDPTNAGSS